MDLTKKIPGILLQVLPLRSMGIMVEYQAYSFLSEII